MAASEIDTIFRASWLFSKRPSPIPGDLRPAWRIAVLLLALRRCCYGGRSSLQRLHVLSWGARTPQARRALLKAVDREIAPEAVIIRFEPSLNRALAFARGNGLIAAPTGDRLVLTPVGREAVSAIEHLDDCLRAERTFFQTLGYRLTEERVRELTVAIGERK